MHFYIARDTLHIKNPNEKIINYLCIILTIKILVLTMQNGEPGSGASYASGQETDWFYFMVTAVGTCARHVMRVT